MDGKEFAILMDCCDIYKDDQDCIIFTPCRKRDKEIVQDIIEKNNLSNISYDRLREIAAEHGSMYEAKNKLKQRRLAEYSQMSSQQIADLSLEDKVEYIELLFPHKRNQNEPIETYQENEDKIKACMYNINFPQSFWDREKQQVDRYTSLIANSSDIMGIIKNWENSSLDDKKNVVLKSAEVFNHVYGDAPEVVFFTPEEERNKENANAHVWAAYYDSDDNKIHFNLERLQDSDNFFAVSVMLHEGTHFRQHTQSFDNESIDRLFNSNIQRTRNYDKDSGIEAFDFYTMQPEETHAYGLQEYMENTLIEKTGIEKKTGKILDQKTKNVHNKAFTMAKIAQYNFSK